MPARLLACPSCARHVRVDEARCPFCGVACTESFASNPAPVAPPLGLSRAELFRFNPRAAPSLVAGAAIAMAIGCSNGAGEGHISVTPAYGNFTLPEPDCSGEQYYVIDPADCPGCKTVAYELCEDSDFTKCTCEAPKGWMEVRVDAGATDAPPPSDGSDGG
jgi:hypothetical protein